MTNVFVASNIDTEYPRKLQKPSTVNSDVRASAETFIMDSGIGDDTDTQQVLDLAHEYDADFVVGKDYLHDRPRTTESIETFLNSHAAHDCDSTPMIPLQPPHAEHYQTITKRFGEQSHYVLGGMALRDYSTGEQVRQIERFADVVHDGAYVHALGVGGGREFIARMAPRGVLDSVDCATPEMAAMNGKVIDAELRQKQVQIHSGEGRERRTRKLAAFNAWQVQDAWTRDAQADVPQTTLAETQQ